VVKVIRNANGYEDVVQLSIQLLLEGDIMKEGFMNGDNSTVVATDTCKNTCYCLAKEHNFESIEEFGMIIARHFLTTYPKFVNKISVRILADRWERVNAPDSYGRVVPHKHVFTREGPRKPFAYVQGFKKPHSDIELKVQAGFSGLEIMKTTQSGFTGFHRDRYTSLPEVEDRLVGTSVTAEWEYSNHAISNPGYDFKSVHKVVKEVMTNTFAGPADKGTYSNSVQQTMYEMGVATLKAVPAINYVTMEMPNIHNIPFDLTRYGYPADPPGISPTIFFPIDEPHGIIRATIDRSRAVKDEALVHRSKL
jgi:urate oxidase